MKGKDKVPLFFFCFMCFLFIWIFMMGMLVEHC